MMNPARSRRGYARILVTGVMAGLGTYLVAADGSVAMSRNQSKVVELRQQRAAATESFIALALANDAATSQALATELEAPNGLKARVTREALPAAHAFWTANPVLRPQP